MHPVDLIAAFFENGPAGIVGVIAVVSGGLFMFRIRKGCRICGGTMRTVQTQRGRTSECQDCRHQGRLR